MFLVGSPLTVVNRVPSSPEKKTWETVFVGPTGGVVWPRAKGRRESKACIPRDEKELQDTPAFAPVAPTQTSLCLAEAATVLGNSPGMARGWPSMVSLVGL